MLWFMGSQRVGHDWATKLNWTDPCFITWNSLKHIFGFSGGSAGKESACNMGDLDSIPGLGRSHGEGKGYPLQYFSLENSVDCIVHGVSKSQTRLRDFHFPNIFYSSWNLFKEWLFGKEIHASLLSYCFSLSLPLMSNLVLIYLLANRVVNTLCPLKLSSSSKEGIYT